jgi:hypothetical protein
VGVSLAWWAEIAGDWSDNGPLLAALFGNPAQPIGNGDLLPGVPAYQPLGLNVIRYNIGASPADQSALPAGCGDFGPGKAVPSPQPVATDPVDPGRDAHQLSVLRTAQRLVAGDGDSQQPVLEAFANSPPWWLVHDRCPAGSLVQDSLTPPPARDDERYAKYLADVLDAFHARYQIDFNTVEPFNEPFAWDDDREFGAPQPGVPHLGLGYWGICRAAKPVRDRFGIRDCQEGANFTGTSQIHVLAALCQDLHHGTYTRRVKVSASDGNTPDTTRGDLEEYRGHTGLPGLDPYPDCLAQVNTHSYSGTSRYTGSGRDRLRDAVAALPGHPGLAMSEYGNGPCASGGKGSEIPGARATDPDTCGGIELATQIADDLTGLRPTSWDYWTALEAEGGWGLLAARDSAAPSAQAAGVHLTKRFHAYGQYTRFIRPNATIYPVSWPPGRTPSGNAADLRLTVAKNADGRVVVVATNPSGSSEKMTLSLKGLPAPDTSRVVPYVTNATHDAAEDSAHAAILRSGTLSGSVPADTVATFVLGSAAVPAPAPSSRPSTADQDVTISYTDTINQVTRTVTYHLGQSTTICRQDLSQTPSPNVRQFSVFMADPANQDHYADFTVYDYHGPGAYPPQRPDAFGAQNQMWFGYTPGSGGDYHDSRFFLDAGTFTVADDQRHGTIHATGTFDFGILGFPNEHIDAAVDGAWNCP